MPSVSRKQARLMAAAAHTKGGYDGVPQSVGREFNEADKGTGILKKQPRKIVHHMKPTGSGGVKTRVTRGS